MEKILAGTLEELSKNRTMSTSKNEHVISLIMEKFAATKKAPVPDLDQRVEKLQKQLSESLNHVSFKFVNGKPYITFTPQYEHVINELRYGSTWFDPVHDIDKLLLLAVF